MFAESRLNESLVTRATGGQGLFHEWADAPVAAPAVSLPAPSLPATEPFAAMADLRQLAEPERENGGDRDTWPLPPINIHPTGSQLRRRLVTPESIAELTVATRPSLMQRLLGRK